MFHIYYIYSFVRHCLCMRSAYILFWVREMLILSCSWCCCNGACLQLFFVKSNFSFTSERRKNFWNLCCSKAGLLPPGEISSVHSCSSGAHCSLKFPLEAAQMQVLGISYSLEFTFLHPLYFPVLCCCLLILFHQWIQQSRWWRFFKWKNQWLIGTLVNYLQSCCVGEFCRLLREQLFWKAS